MPIHQRDLDNFEIRINMLLADIKTSVVASAKKSEENYNGVKAQLAALQSTIAERDALIALMETQLAEAIERAKNPDIDDPELQDALSRLGATLKATGDLATAAG